jgi:hypothetical protein
MCRDAVIWTLVRDALDREGRLYAESVKGSGFSNEY